MKNPAICGVVYFDDSPSRFGVVTHTKENKKYVYTISDIEENGHVSHIHTQHDKKANVPKLLETIFQKQDYFMDKKTKIKFIKNGK